MPMPTFKARNLEHGPKEAQNIEMDLNGLDDRSVASGFFIKSM